jgi:ATP-dependent DNA helicase DinG
MTISSVDNFPFYALRANQEYILREIDSAFSHGFTKIILEAPTGTGKSPLGIAAAMTQGSSYILTSTKNLQTQYHNDFSWVYMAKGRSNFKCPKIEKDAPYKTADHAPCCRDSEYKCSLKTKLKEYYKENEGTKDEKVFLYSEDNDICEYFHQRNKALVASHSVLNYSMFLSLLGLVEPRNLLILDEAHELPSEVLKFQSFTITKNRWQKYISKIGFEIPNLGYDDIKGWIEFLIGLKGTILERMKVNSASEIADIEKKILELSFLQPDNLTAIAKLQERLMEINLLDAKLKNLPVETREDVTRLDSTISTIISEPLNWIVTEIKFDVVFKDIAKVVFKPLNVPKKCQKVFDKGQRVLMMSATILDPNTFCRDVKGHRARS